MATYYWVGGSGTWDATTTTYWATSSGGAGGAGVPTSADSVIFDASSNIGVGAFTVTVAGTGASPAVCLDFSTGGAGGALDGAMTLAFGTTGFVGCYGSLIFPAANFSISTGSSSTGIRFLSTTTGKTVTTNGVLLSNVTLNFNGVGGEWTLGSALSSLTTVTLSAGTLDTGNYNITCGNFNVGGALVKTLNFGSSTIVPSANFTITGSNLTFNAGTSTITLSFASASFIGNGNTFYNVNFTSLATNAVAVTGANTFNNLSFTARTAAGIGSVTFDSAVTNTVNGTLTLGSGTTGVARLWLRGSIVGSPATLSVATLTAITDIDFRDITAAGVSSPWSGTRIGDCLGNTNISFVGARTVYWNSAASANWNAAVWSTSSGAVGGTTAAFPLAQDSIVIDDAGLTLGNTITLNASYNIPPLSFATRLNAATFATGTTTPNFYGDYTLSSAITSTGTGVFTFAKQSGTATVTSVGKTFTQPVTVNASSGTVRIDGDLTLGSTLITTLTLGTLDLTNNGAGNYLLSTGVFSSSGALTRAVAFGTGQINLTFNGGTVWSLATATNFSYTGTPTVNFTYSGSTGTRAFSHGSTAGGTEANAVNLNVTAGSDVFNFGNASHVKSVNFTGFSGTLINFFFYIYGDITISSGMTLAAGANQVNFSATSGTQKITSNAKTLDFPLSFLGVGGTYQLQDDLTVGSTRGIALTDGTLDLTGNGGNWTLSVGTFSSASATTRSIAFGTGKINATGNSATVVNFFNVTGYSYTGTPRFDLSYSGSTGTRTIRFGDNSGTATQTNTPDIYVTAGSDIVRLFTNVTTTAVRSLDTTGFSGSIEASEFRLFGSLNLSATTTVTATTNAINFISTGTSNTITTNGVTIDRPVTFNGIGGTFAFQDALTQGATRAFTITNGTVQLKAGATSTVGSFVTSGSNQKFLQSTTPGTQATISDASGTNTVSNLTIQDSYAAGGATWNALAVTNVNAGNNNGWEFLSVASTVGRNFTLSFGFRL